MDRVELLERKEKKGDILLKMVAISGEMPANLPEKIVGSKSYTASLITALKKKGYLQSHNVSENIPFILFCQIRLQFLHISFHHSPSHLINLL